MACTTHTLFQVKPMGIKALNPGVDMKLPAMVSFGYIEQGFDQCLSVTL